MKLVPVRPDERLDQPRAIMVAALEVRLQSTQRPAQHMTGQVAAPHAGPNQKPAQAHHPMQMIPSLPVAPPHPLVARAQMQRRRRKTDRPQHPVRGDDQIPYLAAGERRRPVRMLEVKQGVPEQAPPVVLDQFQRQPLHIGHLPRIPPGRLHGRFQTARRRCPNTALRRRKRQPARRLQHPQRLQATRQLRRPARIEKAELRAHPATDRRPAGRRLVRKNAGKAILRSRCPKRPENLVLYNHAALIHGSYPLAQSYLWVQGSPSYRHKKARTNPGLERAKDRTLLLDGGWFLGSGFFARNVYQIPLRVIGIRYRDCDDFRLGLINYDRRLGGLTAVARSFGAFV